jgi:hypothetical protein
MAEAPLTRDILRKEIKKKFPSVSTKKNNAYKEATFLTLEEQLGVKRAHLTGVKAFYFDKEFNGFFMNLTRWWGKSPIFWNEDRLKKKHQVWLDHIIRLEPDTVEQPVNNYFFLLIT